MSLSKEQIEQLETSVDITKTRRATVKEIDDILHKVIPVLDHGFIRVVDYMGDDSAIVQAARVSYGAGTKHVTKDRGLIQYLMRHRHSTPFEMCEIKFHIKLPIFIARQWIRHRTANVNEYSARYSILGNDCYIPEAKNIASQSVINNQGRGETLSAEQAKKVQELLEKDATTCYDTYKGMLNENEAGETLDPTKPSVARELARMNLTLNHYTEWYWKIDLHNLFHFLSLRADPHAQFEIREYADAMLETVKAWVPLAYEAFTKYRINGAFLSSEAKRAVASLIKGEKIIKSEYNLSGREWSELFNSLGLKEADLEERIIKAA